MRASPRPEMTRRHKARSLVPNAFLGLFGFRPRLRGALFPRQRASGSVTDSRNDVQTARPVAPHTTSAKSPPQREPVGPMLEICARSPRQPIQPKVIGSVVLRKIYRSAQE